ncbi:RNA polymerase sigma factor [Actinoplanes sp. N902-109]|uniref:RNA polymerase sigma factor n=1 Tax=Actinoplanes sp. (strain N902-109) TaxID=649831 RepID=UPI00032955ED|nr:RNA polymerase sigma factor [Actinoplanes sp. N902-109]AGL17165.1 ECF subfamily RNA polymerase sigma-24 subunit [Actinoplanes sp. N902-109]
MTENDLSPVITAAKTGDEEAFRRLYHAVHPGLLRYLRALVGDEAEDVASEAWLRIARDLGGFTGGSGFRAWAFTVAHNRAIDHVRRTRRQPAVLTPIEHLSDLAVTGDAGEQAAERMSTTRAIGLIAGLPPEQAQAVLLHVVVGFDGPATARMLGKRPGAVRMAASRGLRRLAARVDPGK